MTITVKENSYTPDVSSGVTESGTSVSRVFVATTDEHTNDIELRVLTASGIPKYNSALSSNYPNVKVVSKSAVPASDTDFTTWYVTVTYSSADGETSATTDPVDDPPTYSYSKNQYAIAVDKAYYKEGDKKEDGTDATPDLEGFPTQPVLNTAKDPFDPPLTDVITRPVVSITTNVRDFDPQWIAQFTDSVNAVSITTGGLTAEPEHAKLIDIVPEPQSNDVYGSYWTVTFSIEFSETTYRNKPLNAGLNQIVGDEKKHILYSDIGDTGENKDQPIQDPVKLNADGTVAGSKTEAHYLDFMVKFPKNWETLAIPQTGPKEALQLQSAIDLASQF